MVEDERDCGSQVCDTCFACFALAVGAGQFRAGGDVPRAVLLDYRCELVPHRCILAGTCCPPLLGFEQSNGGWCMTTGRILAETERKIREPIPVPGGYGYR